MSVFNSIIFSFFFLIPFTTAYVYSAIDYFLLDCGSSTSNDTSPDQRVWNGDVGSKFLYSDDAHPSTVTRATDQASSVPPIPFMTARFSNSSFTYNFPLSPGPKFLRLYFYSASYHKFHSNNSFFSVSVGDHHTLLSNFSASLNAQDSKAPSFIKEFIITVGDNQKLDLTFSPSPTSYAFINGIEIVSIPSNHYIKGENSLIKLISTAATSSNFIIENNTALEKVYRLKVGGNDVRVTDDTGLFRAWSQDEEYILGGLGLVPHLDFSVRYTEETPNYTAPEKVYTTLRSMGPLLYKYYNLTWIFPVDSGFHYLMRLHFCEFLKEVTLRNQRVFTIFINNQTAESQADVIDWTHNQGNKIPVFKDYIVWVTDPDGHHSKQDLWLSMRPNLDSNPQYADAFLNGLEIFKLNGTDGSLAGANPAITDTSNRQPEPTHQVSTIPKRPFPPGPIVGGIVGGVAVFAILGLLIFRQRLKKKGAYNLSETKSSWIPFSNVSRSTKTSKSTLPSNLCRHFTIEELKSATNNFDDKALIGKGGFGNVYKGCIDNDTVVVAVKRLNSSSRQGAREFQTEIIMLSNLRHLHLVSLIGYCDDNGEMVLVYDYMGNGTLRDHLYKTANPPLPWKQRLEICIGAARGLHYLHAGAKYSIIHRDVKSTNILLDEKWVAKVSDFGLSKLGPIGVNQSHVSTVVKGSLGYIDPEYYRRQQLTEKSDVYSFGVVLLEVLCGRPAIIAGASAREQVSLAEWAKTCYKRGNLHQIVDPNLKGQIGSDSFKKYVEVAYKCLRDQGSERPGMNDVIWGLEFALQLQESGKLEEEDIGNNGGYFSWNEPITSESKSTGTINTNTNTNTSSSGKQNSESIFSEILRPVGR